MTTLNNTKKIQLYVMDREGVQRVHVELTWRDRETVQYSTAVGRIRTVDHGRDQRQKMTDGSPGVQQVELNSVQL